MLGLGLAACSTSQQVVTSPAALVASSAQRTLAEKTADVTLSGSFTAAGRTVPLSGSGQVDFTSNGMSLTLPIANLSTVIRELAVAGKIYLGITTQGHDLAELTGRHWVELPFNVPSSATSLTSGDPVSALRILENQGATVTNLGSTYVDGLAVRGYSVTPTTAEVLRGSQQLLATSGLTTAQRQAVAQLVENSPPPTITVWIDSSRLLRRMSIDLQLSSGEISAGGTVQMDFVKYGVPVSISAPLPGDVATYQQFLQALAQQGGP